MAPPHCLRLWTRSTARSSVSAKFDTASGMLKFLRLIDQTIPQEKDIYLICDNYATHKPERVIRWLDRHKRCHSTSPQPLPVGSIWWNASFFFRDLTEKTIAPWHLQKCRTIYHGHRKLHRPTQPESKTFHLDRKSFRHTRRSHPRSSLTRKTPIRVTRYTSVSLFAGQYSIERSRSDTLRNPARHIM
jgi:hypothetical protein